MSIYQNVLENTTDSRRSIHAGTDTVNVSLQQSFVQPLLKNKRDLRMTRLQELGRASPLFFSFMSIFQAFRNAGNSHSRPRIRCALGAKRFSALASLVNPALEQGG